MYQTSKIENLRFRIHPKYRTLNFTHSTLHESPLHEHPLHDPPFHDRPLHDRPFHQIFDIPSNLENRKSQISHPPKIENSIIPFPISRRLCRYLPQSQHPPQLEYAIVASSDCRYVNGGGGTSPSGTTCCGQNRSTWHWDLLGLVPGLRNCPRP